MIPDVTGERELKSWAVGKCMDVRGLTDKRIVITGGSSGIGLVTARRFLDEGSRVFLCGVDEQEVERAVAELTTAGAVAEPRCGREPGG